MSNILEHFTVEQVNTFLKECVNRLSVTGVSYEYNQDCNSAIFSYYALYLYGEFFGKLSINRWNEENRLIAEITFYTKIEMITKSSFTKTAMKHKCNIKWNNYRTYELRTDKDWQKCIDWIVLLNKRNTRQHWQRKRNLKWKQTLNRKIYKKTIADSN